MHLIFERSKGRFKSNCNILALAWMPYHNEIKFRQALFDYHQRQLMNLTSSIATNNQPAAEDATEPRVGYLARSHNARLQNNGESMRNNSSNDNNEPPNGASGVNISSQQFLNSRIAELYQRYLYTKDANQRKDNIDSNKLSKIDASLINSELDLKYGRISEFGWLVVGNVGKIVGVTLTSTIAPPREVKEITRNKNNGDLMQFHDANNDKVNENAESTQNKNEKKPNGLLSSSLLETERPDRNSIRNNYNLRGHLDEVIIVKWNELYQKLATVDSKGNVLIWCKINEKFTIQTPFYNRSKSVADFKWSNDGKTALICYTDSFILVGSSSGQRHWHSMLNLDDYHITCASWTPNDEQLLLGVSNGNVVVIDLPRSELTELVINQFNIRTMCWSSCDMNLRHINKLPNCNTQNFNDDSHKRRESIQRNNSIVVNHRRLSRDCSVFSRYRFCSKGPSNSNVINSNAIQSNLDNQNEQHGDRLFLNQKGLFEQNNILAIDFANNTIKLYNGGLDDPAPGIIQVNQESYTMHWSNDGNVLAVAGFTIHTTAPSIGYLKCKYLNAIKFYNQKGQLIYEHAMKYTRYPITAFTWAHNDERIFVATGPKLHCAKVFFGIPPLSLLAISCLQRHTRLPDKRDLLENIMRNCQLNEKALRWQSHNCPLDIKTGSEKEKTLLSEENKLAIQQDADLNKSTTCSLDSFGGRHSTNCYNSNVFQYCLPTKLQSRIDELFKQTIRQPYDEHWSLNDIVWHVPKNNKRYYCTLVCYTSERDISSSGYQYKTDYMDKISDGASDQYKIFVLYTEFEGCLIPILRARRVGFLKPEFVIFDPEDNSSIYAQRQQRKVSDISQHSVFQTNIFQHRMDLSNSHSQANSSSSAFYSNGGFTENCSDLHTSLNSRGSRTSLGLQSMSDAEHYYDFGQGNSEETSYNQHDRTPEYRSTNQEPLVMSSNPYLYYMLSISSGHRQLTSKSHSNGGAYSHRNLPMNTSADSKKRTRKDRLNIRNNGLSGRLTESNELIRIKSNVWGTKFKILNVGNRLIKQRAVLGSVLYKASILHLQPRQIFLNIKDMSNYCCLCSKHHHTRLDRQQISSSACKQPDVSLLDLPNIGSPLTNAIKQSSRKSRRKAKSKEGVQNDNKVVMAVGDAIRVVPKLENNQEYKFSGSCVLDNQKPSTSRCISSNNSSIKSIDRRLDSRKYSDYRNSTNNLRLNNPKQSFPYPSSNSHSKCNRVDYLSETPSSENNDDQEDDVLTLSLDQENQMKLEMSSLNNSINDTTAPNNDLDNFLASNKTLKSIQSITKMIVDLSSKADDDDASMDNAQVSSSENLPSPSKLVKLEGSDSKHISKASNYITPETPVHRPRRLVGPRIPSDKQTKLQTHSASTTPLRHSRDRPRRARELRKGTYSRNDDTQPESRHQQFHEDSLPPPPPSVPFSRRLSSSAKRFFDGSMRSLYGGYSTSDMELEENEPLVFGQRRKVLNKTSSKRLIGYSQPTTPVKNNMRKTIDLFSVRDQLVRKIRGRSTDQASYSNSSNQLDNYKDINLKGRRANSSRKFANISSSDLDFSSDFSSTDDESSLNYRKSDTGGSGMIFMAGNHLKDAKRKLNKLAFLSTSVKNLNELDSRNGIRGSDRQIKAGLTTSRHYQRRKRYRRKSICSNNSCCCAKEFKLNNRPPVWNELSQVYQLDFGGRVTQESAKNLQIDFEGNLALQFGRIDRCTYTLDYKYPFNAVQAMAIALASLTQRLK